MLQCRKEGLVACFFLCALVHCGGDDVTAAPTRWVATWAAAQQDSNEIPPFPQGPQPTAQVVKDETIRQIVHTSIRGTGLRIKLSNRFGNAPVTLANVRIARSTGGASIDASSDRSVTFAQATTTTLPAGADAWSDLVSFDAATNADLAVSFYIQAETRVATGHSFALRTNYVGAGNIVSAPTMDGATTSTSYRWLAGIDVATTETTKVVVAFGDSITDGLASTVGMDHRWPNYLDQRAQTAAAIGRVSVVNAGIGGNRWLHDGMGPSGSGRLERDVIDTSGATHAILLLGTNDIGVGVLATSQAVSAEQITGSIDAAIAKGKQAGLKIYLGTLLPFKGAIYYTEAGEASRQSVNTWIRANKSANGVIDFDQATRDPADPATLQAAYDSGDHLHPNDAGYQAMGNAIDLNALE